MRLFESPEINITEFQDNFSGTFHGIYFQMSANKKGDGYEGWLLSGEKKISAEITPSGKASKDKPAKPGGKFGDVSYVFDSLDAKNGVYKLKKGDDEAEVRIMFEYRNGKHMVNPLFIVKNNNRNYIVRMKGECCYGRGLILCPCVLRPEQL